MKFRRLSLMEWKKVIFYTAFLSMIILQLVNDNNNLLSRGSNDEDIYKRISQKVVDIGTVSGLFDSLKNEFEIKSAPFMALQVILRAYETIIYTRAFNIVLIFLIMFIMYDMTKRKEVLLFPIIIWFLNTLFLTNEIVEVFFVVLSIRFAKYSGILIGVATLLRPWALVYSILLKYKQLKYVLLIGFLYVLMLIYYDSFFFYLGKVIDYSTEQSDPDLVATVFATLFVFIGYKTELFWYGMISMLSLSTRLSYHYFIPMYSLFFFGYLLQLKSMSDNKISINNLTIVKNER